MVMYDWFEFASAPDTGEEWFLEAMRAVGQKEGSLAVARTLFANEVHPPLRVSLARHPISWMASDHQRTRSAETITGHLWRQLNAAPPVGRLMLSYGADVFLRAEDLPGAFVQLINSLGVPGAEFLLAQDLFRRRPPELAAGEPELDPTLRRAIMARERELCELFCYF